MRTVIRLEVCDLHNPGSPRRLPHPEDMEDTQAAPNEAQPLAFSLLHSSSNILMPQTAWLHPSGEAFHLSLPSWVGLSPAAKALTHFHRGFPMVPRRGCRWGGPQTSSGGGKISERPHGGRLLCSHQPPSCSPQTVRGHVPTATPRATVES